MWLSRAVLGDLPAVSLDHAALADDILKRKPILESKLARACSVAEAQTPALLCEVLRFLDLCASAGQSLTPSPTVDDAWHELVLCTRLYAEFCHEHFGRFIHHDPGGSEDDNRRQFRETLRRYALRFDAPDPEYWGSLADQTPTANCGGCES